MKNKSSKLAKMEKNRFSIFTNNLTQCYYCKAPKDDLHEIFGGCRRIVSMKFGLVLPLCRTCHTRIENDEKTKLEMKKKAEIMFLETYRPFGIDDFIQIFGKNFL
jgi:hypothetical protein